MFRKIHSQNHKSQAASMPWDEQIDNRKEMAQVWPPGLSHLPEAEGI